MSHAEPITDPNASHGEGPVWHPGWPGLRWVDMLAGEVLQLDARTGRVTRHGVGSRIAAAIRPRKDGGAVIAIERGFALADADLNEVRPLREVWADPRVRMNDGDCSPDGHFYCGSMAYDESPGAGSLYRMAPDGTTAVMFERITISNGLAWSPDGHTAYYIDTPTQRVEAFDYTPNGQFSNRRTLFRIPESEGAPDGMTVDTEGRLWIALWGGAAVHCYTPAGHLENCVELPVTQVTACTFGGPELDELYITTSPQAVAPGTQPAAGALFRARPGAHGFPARCYAMAT